MYPEEMMLSEVQNLDAKIPRRCMVRYMASITWQVTLSTEDTEP